MFLRRYKNLTVCDILYKTQKRWMDPVAQKTILHQQVSAEHKITHTGMGVQVFWFLMDNTTNEVFVTAKMEFQQEGVLFSLR